MEKFAVIFVLFGLALGSDVLDLSDGGFEAEAKGRDIMLVEFFAPWCGHCKKLAPEYEVAATALAKNDPPVPLAKVDCTDESGGKDTCGKYGVSGYPTLKIFRNGAVSADYSGPRDSAGIVSHMKKMAGPLAKEISSVADMEKVLSKTETTVIAGFFSKDNNEKAAFVQAAGKLHENYKFVYTLSEAVSKNYGFSDAVALFRPRFLKNKFEEGILQMTEAVTKSNIEKFAEINGLGMCGVMKADNKDLFKKPVVVAYFKVDYEKNPKGTNYFRNRVMKIAKKYNELTFAIASKAEFAREMDGLGFAVDSDAVNVAAWGPDGDKFKMEEEFTTDGKALDAFVAKFVAGEIPNHLKSEPIPEPNDGPVKVVVGNNFKDIVMDETKDVLIEFYAPWCGHCKNLEPKYNELGEKLKDVEHVTIAKMDATANDSPGQYAVSGFPTIYWAPANDKNNPRKYQGGREVDDFIKFIKKESTKPVKLGGKKPDEL
ncbi:protein disulfide-isomerase A3-like [Asterias amurensis]|uniref:protein disulfide-isomerase A3-like n=1 Tax=Asterias amurensis TaxID=7602 RepID=UPI003AB156F9